MLATRYLLCRQGEPSEPMKRFIGRVKSMDAAGAHEQEP